VEPNPETLPLLRRNIADTGFVDRVEVIEKALTDAPGRLTFYSAPGGDTSSLHPQGHSARAVDVETAALDALVDEPARVSAIKIDVEGGEVAALEGMRATIAGAGSDLRLFVECNPEALALAGTDPDRLWATLEGLGLEPRVIDESRRTLAGREQLAAIDGYANLVCAPVRR
jgi:FkbM family methyltransferase